MKPIEAVLSIPRVFEWQQKLCNNYDAIRDEFGEHLKASGRTILDIGCSTGTCGSRIVAMDVNRYYGVDIDPDYVRVAKERNPAGNFLCMDARTLEFQSGFFDIVLFTGVLHHMDDRLIRDCLREVRRVLKPGTGVALVAEPVFTPGMPLSNLLLWLDRGRHIRAADGYRALFDGFAVERERFFRFSLHRFCSFVLKAG